MISFIRNNIENLLQKCEKKELDGKMTFNLFDLIYLKIAPLGYIITLQQNLLNLNILT